MYVWYASYGSNILYERFMCYINGTKPPGSAKAEVGCTDQTPPWASRKVSLPYPLYFSKERSKWGVGGVAFIDNHESADRTIGRMYLITEQQFTEVVAQENNMPSIEIDLNQIKRTGAGKVHAGSYGEILYAGETEGYPIFTFTNPQSVNNVSFTKPNRQYLSTIADGSIELGLTKQEIVNYFIKVPGIAGRFTKATLFAYLFNQN